MPIHDEFRRGMVVKDVVGAVIFDTGQARGTPAMAEMLIHHAFTLASSTLECCRRGSAPSVAWAARVRQS